MLRSALADNIQKAIGSYGYSWLVTVWYSVVFEAGMLLHHNCSSLLMLAVLEAIDLEARAGMERGKP